MNKKIIFVLIGLMFTMKVMAAPTNSMSISPSASSGTAITAADENARNNEVSTKFNAHDHIDINQTANTLNVGDGAVGDKTINANNADANKPFIKYDDTANNWILSTDGVTSSIVLSGTGISFEGTLLTPGTAGKILVDNMTVFTVGTIITDVISGPTVSFTGGQIKFPSIDNPSADVNTLDDYEEGTFTPELEFGGASTNTTYSQQAGKYTKIGDRVFFKVYIILTDNGDSTGDATITGLPFVVGNGDAFDSVPSMSLFDATFADVYYCHLNNNDTIIGLHEITEGGTNTTLTENNLGNASRVLLMGHYIAQ